MNYILEGKTPVPTNDIMLWGKAFEGPRTVNNTEIDNTVVSTVFLGIEHGQDISGRPILFETMVFGGEYDGYQDRYCTWEEAESRHHKVMEMILN